MITCAGREVTSRARGNILGHMHPQWAGAVSTLPASFPRDMAEKFLLHLCGHVRCGEHGPEKEAGVAGSLCQEHVSEAAAFCAKWHLDTAGRASGATGWPRQVLHAERGSLWQGRAGGLGRRTIPSWRLCWTKATDSSYWPKGRRPTSLTWFCLSSPLRVTPPKRERWSPLESQSGRNCRQFDGETFVA